MGMDVYGLNPKSEKGEYFRNNIWFWRPLWDYCLAKYPDIAGKVKDGHSNVGDGLDQKDAELLAEKLLEDIKSGDVAEYSRIRKQAMELLPLETCTDCGGIGKIDEDNCKICDGIGEIPPWISHYGFSEENMKDFQEFLQESGGFEIC